MSTNSARPAAVEPAMELTADEIARYSRQLILPEVGMIGQRRLKNARVLVIGAGGLGAPALLYLAAAGVGTIGVVDDDTVDLSNLSRQVIHTVADVGKPKLDSAAESIAALNPLVTVEKHALRLDADAAAGLFAEYDVILDGTDNFGTRYLISDAATAAGKPHVWGSILRFDGQVSVFYSGAGERGPTYRDLYPESPPAGLAPSCEEAGVLGVLCSSIGSVMAAEAVKLATGMGRTLIGRLLVFDALDMTWQEIPVAASSAAPPAAVPGQPADRTPSGVPEFDPPSVSATELAARLADRESGSDDFELIDVRGRTEHEIVAVPGARVVPLAEFETGRAFESLPADKDIVVHCKSGGRSLRAVRLMHEAGYTRAIQMDGGVLAWIDQVAPELPAY